MLRKLIVAAIAVMLPVALLTTITSGVASAAFPPVTFTGNISCNLTGTMTISPAATSTSTGPYTVTFVGKNPECFGLYGTSLTVSIASTGQTVKLKRTRTRSTSSSPRAPAHPGACATPCSEGGPPPPSRRSR